MNIYEIGTNSYWTGRINIILDSEAAPLGWTRATVPVLLTGEYARWRGTWQITTIIPVTLPRVFDDTTQALEISAVNAASRLIRTQRITAQLVTKGQI